ncbi:hypothetical protein [Nocardioides dongkuii]|uniref:hypothetical protein n=1 Tax=Nocardioides dongkuii TaxID=2760089 RepID=UPI001877EA18|nr:hypothetical protein [Nocardioides dongkuii]
MPECRIDHHEEDGSRSATAALVVSGALTLSTVVALVWLSGRGLDLTDEGYYLLWLSEPGRYAASTSQFGFVYHPLHVLLGGDVALLRTVNVLLVLALAWVLAHQVLTRLAGWRPEARWQALVCSAGLATTATGVFSLGLLTPSYNSLSLQGLLVAVTGVVLVVSGAAGDRATWVGWVLVGVGGWLTFLAKPTTALALAVLVAVVLVAAGTVHLRGLAVAALTAAGLLLLTAIAIDGSVAAFVRRLRDGTDLLAALDGGHGLGAALRWDAYEPSLAQAGVLVAVAAGTALATLAGVAQDVRTRVTCGLGAALVVGLAVWGTRGDADVFVVADPFSASLLLGLPLAALGLLLLLGGRPAVRRITRAQWAVAGLLLLLPHGFAFGTNNDYWRVAGQAAVFWVLLAVVLVAPLAGRPRFRWVLAPLLLGAQVLAVLVVLPAVVAPYRQPGPAWQLDAPATVRGSSLTLHTAVARHLGDTTAAVRAAGLEEGEPVLDLTGRSPGLLHAWGAHALGQPWLFGGYPGSAEHAAAALATVPCDELARAWVLTEPRGPRRLPASVLATFGATPRDFAVAASWTAPREVTRDAPQPQQLREPLRDPAAAEEACRRARDGSR